MFQKLPVECNRISQFWLTWIILGRLINSRLTVLIKLITASVSAVYRFSLSNGGTCIIIESKESGRGKSNLVAGISE